MRHRKKGKILSRPSSARKALFRNLATQFVLHESLRMTETKAKVLKPIIEKCITISRAGDLHARRQLLKFLYTENAVKKLLETIGPKYKERRGGYTRITKLGFRPGDGAPVVRLELVK
ncbi:MAG: 50S ribosomal protein L17 [Parcubacteria group bacterium]|nr:50S ribosomal protein L17 [Parcubacteria group bacterium]